MTLRIGEDGTHPTYCRVCEALCGLLAEVEDGKIVHVGPDREHPVSKGHLCVKGPGMLDVTYDPDRVLTPLRRAGAPGNFEPVSWDEALSDITDRLEQIVSSHGGEALGGYFGNPGAFSTLHYTYRAGFLRSFGSSKIFNALHVDVGARVLANELVFGHPTRYPFPDLDRCDFLLMLGANPVASKMSLVSAPRSMEKLKAIAARGSVVVVDPRKTETARMFEHRPILPDTDAWLLAGMLKALIDQGRVQTDLLAGKVTGWGDLAAVLSSLDVADASLRCGVPVDDIAQLAERFAAARTAACYGRAGTNRGSFSTLTNVLMDALNLATGRFGCPGGSIIGTSPFEAEGDDQFQAYGSSRSRIGDLPLVAGLQPGGALAEEILTPGEGQIRVLFIDSGNPVMAYPDGDKIERALESLSLLVALDFYVTESTKHAHYILPTPTFFERADTTDMWSATMPEPWVQYCEPVVEPLGESRHEYEIYDAILKRVGKPDSLSFLLDPENASVDKRLTHLDVADAALRLGYTGDKFGEAPDGLSFAKLKSDFPHGKQVLERMPAEESWNRVHHPGNKPSLWDDVIAGEWERLLKSPVGVGPDELRLFGRRNLHAMNSWMHNSQRLAGKARPTLLMHPDDARDRQIRDSQRVRVESKTNQIEVDVEISDEVVPGSVSYPHGWGHAGGWRTANGAGGANVNLLASSDPADWERISGMCLLDGIAVTVTPRSE